MLLNSQSGINKVVPALDKVENHLNISVTEVGHFNGNPPKINMDGFVVVVNSERWKC